MDKRWARRSLGHKKRVLGTLSSWTFFGADDRIRTGDPHLANKSYVGYKR